MLANEGNDNVSVIDGATNQVIATVPVKSNPRGVGVNPNTNRVYVTNTHSNNVSVINGATNQVIAMVPVENDPRDVCVNPKTNRVYVTNNDSGNVSVIDDSVSKRLGEFIKKNGVEEWPDISEFSANPFIYEGKIVALRVSFREMQTATQGIFAEVGSMGAQPFIVSDIPKGMFKEEGLIVVLAGKVIGKTELQVPLLGLMQVPHLKFVGVHFCQDNNCNDVIPEEASLKKATHDSEDRKTHSIEPQKELTTKEALQQEQELENNNATAIEEAKKQQIPSLQEEGSNALENQNWNAAVQAYKKLLEIAPENYEANTNIGTAYTMLNEFDLSIKHLTKAQQLKPAEYQPYYLMGIAYAKKGDKDRAIDSLRDAFYKGYKDLSVSDLEKDTNFPEDFKQDQRFKGLLGKLEINKLISSVKDVHLFDNHSQTFPYKYDNVWDAVNYTLKDQDEKIIQSDKETGIVVTDTCRWAMNRKYYKYYILVERENDISSKLNLILLAHDSIVRLGNCVIRVSEK